MKRKLNAVNALIEYAVNKGLIEPMDRNWARNAVLDVLKLDAVPDGLDIDTDINAEEDSSPELHEILDVLLDDAFQRGVIHENSVVYRDLLDTEIMGRLTPRPSETAARFYDLYTNGIGSSATAGCSCDPAAATDWFYRFSQDTNYIRRDRMARDVRWKVDTEYGELDITINLSKPEKDPKAIAAARNAAQTAYPKCQLCRENEGYAGRLNHPARENHRIIPLKLNGDDWYLQYSPYVYYNEHCIVFNEKHVPMKIDGSAFRRLLDFVRQFPHYFVGSNADLPIVGGSILSHEHFQGGRYTFAMADAPLETEWTFRGFEDVKAGIVHWPMSVIRLTAEDPEQIAQLSEKILAAWRAYSDEACMIYAETDGVPHNTITPICRRRGECYEMDLVLRNNLTTEEHPLGVFHPHSDLHHIKKENIGLIEVMGLAVLPGRLKTELDHLADALVKHIPAEDYGDDIRKHAEWASRIADEYTITKDNADEILRNETGKVFARVLEDAGVYKHDKNGREGFLRFLKSMQEE